MHVTWHGRPGVGGAGRGCGRLYMLHVPQFARTLRRETNARRRTAVKLLLRHLLMRQHVLTCLCRQIKTQLVHVTHCHTISIYTLMRHLCRFCSADNSSVTHFHTITFTTTPLLVTHDHCHTMFSAIMQLVHVTHCLIIISDSLPHNY